MAEADSALKHSPLERDFQNLQLAGSLHDLDAGGGPICNMAHSNARGVVAAVFEALKSVDNDTDRPAVADVPYYATHKTPSEQLEGRV